MFDFRLFPYTNFNRVNLDWIFATLKKLVEGQESMEQAVEEASNAASEAVEAAATATAAAESAIEVIAEVESQVEFAVDTATEAKEIAEGIEDKADLAIETASTAESNASDALDSATEALDSVELRKIKTFYSVSDISLIPDEATISDAWEELPENSMLIAPYSEWAAGELATPGDVQMYKDGDGNGFIYLHTAGNYNFDYAMRLALISGEMRPSGNWLATKDVYEINDIIEISSAQTGGTMSGYISYVARNLYFSFVAPKSLELISNIEILDMTGTVRGVGGLVGDSGSNFDWLNQVDITCEATVGENNVINLTMRNTTAYTNATNNTCAVFIPSFLRLRLY